VTGQIIGGCVGLVLGVGVLFVIWRIRDGYWWP